MVIKTAFIHGDSKEDIYMVDLEGVKSYKGELCYLRKSLMVSKKLQDVEMKGSTIFFCNLGSERFRHDYCLYVRNCGNENWMYIVLYMEDLLQIWREDRALLESIMYVMLNACFDICYAIGYLDRFQQNPGNEHSQSLKRIVRYRNWFSFSEELRILSLSSLMQAQIGEVMWTTESR